MNYGGRKEDGLLVITNPMDGRNMYWYANEFTANNWPDVGYQMEQKKESLKYVLEQGVGVLDLGSHIGDYGIPLAMALKNMGRNDIKVYCVDPSPSKCAFMRKVCDVNSLTEDNIKVVCTGVSDNIGRYSVTKLGEGGTDQQLNNQLTIGKIYPEIDKEHPLRECVVESNSGAWQWIPDEKGQEFTTLDIMRKEGIIGDIGFFWLDAQWMEEEVLRGGKEFLTKNKPLILMEYYPVQSYCDDNVSVEKSVVGTREQLIEDTTFTKLFGELGITISTEGSELDDILLTWK